MNRFQILQFIVLSVLGINIMGFQALLGFSCYKHPDLFFLAYAYWALIPLEVAALVWLWHQR